MTKPTKPPRKRLDREAIAAHLRRVLRYPSGSQWSPFDPFWSQDDFVEEALELANRPKKKIGEVEMEYRGTVTVWDYNNKFALLIKCGPAYGPLRHRIACAVAVATGFPVGGIELPAKGKKGAPKP